MINEWCWVREPPDIPSWVNYPGMTRYTDQDQIWHGRVYRKISCWSVNGWYGSHKKFKIRSNLRLLVPEGPCNRCTGLTQDEIWEHTISVVLPAKFPPVIGERVWVWRLGATKIQKLDYVDVLPAAEPIEMPF